MKNQYKVLFRGKDNTAMVIPANSNPVKFFQKSDGNFFY